MADKSINEEMRKLPSVEVLLEAEELKQNIKKLSRTLVAESVREAIGSFRKKVKQGLKAPSQADLIKETKADIVQKWCGFQTPVINASGVILPEARAR